MPPKLFSTRQRQRARAHRSSSQTTPDVITSRLFPRRSPQRSSANADAGGLKPSPAGRLRRARQPPSLRTAPQPAGRPSRDRPAFRVHVHNTTTVFSQRSMRRFDASPRRATPKAIPSSPAQHHAQKPCLPQAPSRVRDTLQYTIFVFAGCSSRPGVPSRSAMAARSTRAWSSVSQ
jgi:hypothetical protein